MPCDAENVGRYCCDCPEYLEIGSWRVDLRRRVADWAVHIFREHSKEALGGERCQRT